MAPHARFINIGRGPIVVTDDLVDALVNEQIAGAALDVFETEPLTADAAQVFDGLGNLILTPHIAGVTQDSNTRVSAMIADLVLEELG